jgi:hypothetical protein
LLRQHTLLTQHTLSPQVSTWVDGTAVHLSKDEVKKLRVEFTDFVVNAGYSAWLRSVIVTEDLATPLFRQFIKNIHQNKHLISILVCDFDPDSSSLSPLHERLVEAFQEMVGIMLKQGISASAPIADILAMITPSFTAPGGFEPTAACRVKLCNGSCDASCSGLGCPTPTGKSSCGHVEDAKVCSKCVAFNRRPSEVDGVTTRLSV